jgi:hypothetical protein
MARTLDPRHDALREFLVKNARSLADWLERLIAAEKVRRGGKK